MTEGDPAAPSEAPVAPKGPTEGGPEVVANTSSAPAWIGIAVVALGAAVMVVGVVAVYLYVKQLPPATPPSLPAPVPSAVAVPPYAPAPQAAPPGPEVSPTAPRRVAPPPVALSPFAEDARSLVPVERGRPLWGPRNAPVTLTLFGDLECPYTIALLRVVFAEKARRGDDLRLAFRFQTLSQHAEGAAAAQRLLALHAAQGEGAFWGVMQEIAVRGEPLGEGDLDAILEALGASVPEPPLAVDKLLEEDAMLAASLYVNATPVAFVNGVRVDGFRSQRALAEIIARERRLSGLVLASGVTPQALYAERTRKNLVDLGKDPPERACVPVGGSPVRGAKDALVTIVEFTEHVCDYCREGDALVAAGLVSRPNEVRSVWKSLPLPQHPRARYAANFALEARSVGGDAAFWSVTETLFGAKDGLADPAIFTRAAQGAKLDPERLRTAADRAAHDDAIAADRRLAESLGVAEAAPTYFVNGRRIAGVESPAGFRAILAEELELARRVRKSGAGDVAELACGARALK
jgi:protein-disulfide isomerase